MKIVIDNIDTKITDKWGVQWDEMETVRDFLQNFYDANVVEDIKIQVEGSIVTISAPTVFDYNELIYLGSDKAQDPNAIGQYGEGFKASVVNALRNWNCEIEFSVLNKQLRFYFKNMFIGKSDKRVIFCEVSEIEPISGSKLVVYNCTTQLVEEFKFGLNHFYYESNPLFGTKLTGTYQKDINVYKSNDDKNGYVFYKKLLRYKTDLPIVIVCNKEYKIVENKIKHDRDRKAFNDEVLETLLKMVFKNFRNYELQTTILSLENWFEKGHKLLAIIADTRSYRDRGGIEFPLSYYAKENSSRNNNVDNYNLTIETNKVLEEFKKLGYRCCPRYMQLFGMQTPDVVAQKRMTEKQEQLNKAYSRDLTFFEKQGIDILSYFIKELSESLYKKFENAKYTTGENEEIIGELKKKRGYNQQHVFINRDFFTFPFNEALAILLHEWAHIYGGDGSRTFSDALTHFIALILKSENAITSLKNYEKNWDLNVIKIKEEREIIQNDSQLDNIVSNLSNEQLEQIIKEIPREEIFKILNKINITPK